MVQFTKESLNFQFPIYSDRLSFTEIVPQKKDENIFETSINHITVPFKVPNNFPYRFVLF